MKGYRTLLVATAVFALGIMQSTDFHNYLHTLGLDGNGTVTSVIGIIMGLLRLMTTTAAFTSTPKDGDDNEHLH